jgi:hypothetical protein
MLPPESPQSGGLENLDTITNIRKRLFNGTNFAFSDVLAVLRQANATDPRDMMYGLLGLFPDTSIQPNYTSDSIRDIYIQLINYCINQEQSLDVLTLYQKSTLLDALDLPSWVPDWTSQFS